MWRRTGGVFGTLLLSVLLSGTVTTGSPPDLLAGRDRGDGPAVLVVAAPAAVVPATAENRANLRGPASRTASSQPLAMGAVAAGGLARIQRWWDAAIPVVTSRPSPWMGSHRSRAPPHGGCRS